MFGPLRKLRLHRVAPIRPVGADLGERQIALGKLRAAAVDPIEDVDDNVERLVGAGHFLDMNLDVGDPEQTAQSSHVLTHFGSMNWISGQSRDKLTEACGALLQEPCDVDPKGIVLHLHRLEELERLAGKMESQPREGLGIAVEKLRRATANDAVERRHSLLAVKEQLHDPSRKGALAPVVCRTGFSGPDEQPSDGMAAVEGVKKSADLVAVPDVASLKLRQRHVAAVDVVEDG